MNPNVVVVTVASVSFVYTAFTPANADEPQRSGADLAVRGEGISN